LSDQWTTELATSFGPGCPNSSQLLTVTARQSSSPFAVFRDA
jgi:hypothetical protein